MNSKLKTMQRMIINNPQKLIRAFGKNGLLNWIPDKTYLKMVYYGELNKKLNIENPIEFNEKLQWLKLNDRNIEYSKYVDKYEVREHIQNIIGKQYLIPLLGVYDRVEEIEWDKLPNKFVLKCTHGSHCNIICKDKSTLDKKVVVSKLNNWMKRSWYWFGREWPYKQVKPRIICEKFMGELDDIPNDFKIMCFNGEPRIIQIHKKSINGHHTIDFYDMDGNLTNIKKIGFKNSDTQKIDIDELKEMLDISRKLSKDTLYLRTDFYLVNGKIYFGELTFYDSSGFIDFEPKESNIVLGELLKIDID